MITLALYLGIGLFAQNDPEFDAPTAVQTPSEIWELRPQKVMPRQSIAPGVVHHYLIEAQVGDRIEGFAAQLGVDLQLRLWGPNRKKWKTFDFHSEGLEAFRHRAKNHGAYLLEVTSLNNTAGDYEIYLAMSAKEADDFPDLSSQVLNLLAPNQPGLAFGVIQKGELRFLGSRGMADMEKEIPLNLHVPFHVQYLSFPMYAHVFLELERQDLVDLDRPVSQFLPWFPDYGVEISLRDLISIRAGLPDCLPLMQWIDGSERRNYSRAELIDFLSVEQLWKPQGDWASAPSLTDEILIQEVLCAITGKDLASSMETFLFGPLGMKDSQVEDADQYPLVGDRYWGLANGEWLPQRAEAPSAPFLASSVQDLAIWFQYLTSPSGELAGTWKQLRAWKVLTDFGWTHRLRCRVNPVDETILLVKSSTYEQYVLLMGYGVWGCLFESWPLQKPGRNIALGGRGVKKSLRYPSERIRDPFCGEYQCDQGDLRIVISKGNRHLVLSDGRDLDHTLLVAHDKKSLFTESYTLVSSLVFGELDRERYEGFTAKLRGSGRASFHRVESEPEEPQ